MTITYKPIFYVNVLWAVIDVPSSNEIDGRLIVGIEYSRGSNRDLNRIKKITKP